MRSLEEELRVARRDNALLLALYREEMMRRAFAEERLREMEEQAQLSSNRTDSASVDKLSVDQDTTNVQSKSKKSKQRCTANRDLNKRSSDINNNNATTSDTNTNANEETTLKAAYDKAAPRLATNNSVTYFVHEDGTPEASMRSHPILADALWNRNKWFIRRAHDRQMRIMEASKRRTLLSAEKRDLAKDLLSKRVSVQNALPKLSTDLGDVHAFSLNAMKQATFRRLQKTNEFKLKKSKDIDERNRQADRLLTFCYSQTVRTKQARGCSNAA